MAAMGVEQQGLTADHEMSAHSDSSGVRKAAMETRRCSDLDAVGKAVKTNDCAVPAD